MLAITLHIILYDELMHVASQTFRADRIKKGRIRGRHAVRRRTRRKIIRSDLALRSNVVQSESDIDFFFNFPPIVYIFKMFYTKQWLC